MLLRMTPVAHARSSAAQQHPARQPPLSRTLDSAASPISARQRCICKDEDRARRRQARLPPAGACRSASWQPALHAAFPSPTSSRSADSARTCAATPTGNASSKEASAASNEAATTPLTESSADATAESSPAAPVADTGDKAEAELLPGMVYDVEELRGVRVNVDENQLPLVEYLVHWKGGAPDTWEPSGNVAENLLRDYEDRWWKACREGNEEGIKLLLGGGQRVLSQCVDKERRSALHFAAATGNPRITRILCEAGSEINLMDKDGYTPLHMATGYLHTPVVQLLLEYSADPEIRDRQGRSVLDLAENLKEQMPDDPQLAQRKFALQNCSEILTGTLFDELEPMQLLDSRTNEDKTQDFLVQWPDDTPDSWVNQAMVAEDLQEDYKSNLEWAEAAEILRVVVRGDAREYLVKWADSESYPDSWELEENLSPSLIEAWEAEQPADSAGRMTSKVEGLKAIDGKGRGPKLKKRSSGAAKSNREGSRDGSSSSNGAQSGSQDANGSSMQHATTAQAVAR